MEDIAAAHHENPREFSPSLPNPTSYALFNNDDDDEGDMCRICRNPGEPDNPLRYPCACSGSIKFVHQSCLLQWLNHSNKRQCEVCKHAFAFSPVYADNAPSRLPFQEFIVGIGIKACHVLQFFVRLAFVLSVWLVIIPFITFWLWRFTFVRTFTEAQKLFLNHISAAHLILTDCLHGFLLSAGIVFIFLGATSLRDYFRRLQEIGHDGEREDEGNERNGARAARRLNRVNNEDGAGAPVIGGAGQIIRRNAENVAARFEAHVEQMFDGLDDADGAEDIPFDELVGMQGPVFHLIENAITILASNAIFLGAVVYVPFSLGRLILCHHSWFFSSASVPMLSTLMPLIESTFTLANSTLKNALVPDSNISSQSQNEGVLGYSELNTSAIGGFTSSVLRSSHLADVTTLAIGYIFISGLALLYLAHIALIRYTRGERIIFGRLYDVASIVEAIPSLFRQLLSGMKHLMTIVKVAFILVIELGVFPSMCGWWLDVCTLKMLGTSISKRLEFFALSPLASSSLHWLVGIIFMLQISIFVSLLRRVLRTGVLHFLRDPADPNYNPFRDLIDDPVHKHARRVLLSIAVYGSLIVMLVFLPVKLAMRLAPSVFPLDITIFDPFTEIPADVLLFQICIPFAIEHFKPRATIKAFLREWFIAVGWALGLAHFLLPRPEDNNNNNGNENNRIPLANENHERMGHAIRNDVIEEDSDEDDLEDSEHGFVLRIMLLLVLAWVTLLLLNAAAIVVPVSIGRALFNAIPRYPLTHGIKCNDLYAFSIGGYVIWALLSGTRYCVEYIKTRRSRVLASQIRKWCAIVLKSCALLSIWIFVIPVLIGLLFELLVIVPMRVPVDESPVFLLYQDWALGLIFLRIWTRLVMLDQMAPVVNENWRVKFERVKQDGFSGLRGLWVLREIVIPIISTLLTALCVPYVFARGLFPALGYPLIVNSAVYRFAWLACLVFGAGFFCAKRFHVWFTNLHNSIRDDRYLVGRRLHDFGEGSRNVVRGQESEVVGP